MGGGGLPRATSSAGAFIGEAEQLDHSVHILRRAKGDRHPARIRQDMVRPGPTVGDQLVPNPAREGKVRDPVAVDVPELAPADTKLGPPEPVRFDRDALP